MATNLSYELYDTVVMGVAAGTEHTLFQVAQGGDTTHTRSFTNSRGAGQLPGEENFFIDAVKATLDETAIAADREGIWVKSYLEIRVADETLLQVPLSEVACRNGYGGHYTQAAAAEEALIGLIGDGYKLKYPIKIPGGTAFRVNVYQGTAVAAGTEVRVILDGVLERP